MEAEIINTKNKLVLESSNTLRYLGYPRKVPLWEITFTLPKKCLFYRNKSNSDISVEIENYHGKAHVPSLTKEESIKRLKLLIPEIIFVKEIFRA
tara:strand:+ start:59 stop:343 length:285 start_codon:yes stop_codon:yes gene_type:complete